MVIKARRFCRVFMSRPVIVAGYGRNWLKNKHLQRECRLHFEAHFPHRRMFCTALQHIQDALLQNVTGRSRRFDSAVKSEYSPGTLDCSQPAAAFLPQQPAAEQQCRRCSRYPGSNVGSNVDGPVSHPGPVTRILHPLAFADKSPPPKKLAVQGIAKGPLYHLPEAHSNFVEVPPCGE